MSIVESSAASETVAAAAEPELPGVWVGVLGDATRPEAGGLSRTTVVSDGRSRELYLLSDGGPSRPAVARSGSCGVIFDGVLYNREQLRDHRVNGSALPLNDADLVLRAYQQWGEDALRKIKGIFTLLIWDSRRDLLLCVRDHLGVYPLFYAEAGRELLASTSIESLLRHPRVSRAVNRPALADQLRYRWLNVEETVYESVKRVPPGHVLRMAEGNRRVYRYWDPAPPDRDVNWIREDELEQFDTLLDQAIERCMQFGPSAIFLSGGLDSVTIAAVTTDHCRRNGLSAPLALSLAFPHPDANEEAIQKSVARDLGLPQVLMPFDDAVAPHGLVFQDLEISRTLSMPLLNGWLPAYRRLGLEGRRRGCTAIFHGTGGDEWLAVSPYLAADLLRRLDVVGFYRLWDCVHRSFPRTQLGTLRILLWVCGLRPLLFHAMRRAAPPSLLQARQRRLARAIPGWLAPDPALRQELARRGEQLKPETQCVKAGFYVTQMRTALDHPMVSLELEENFENARFMGVRVLQPFWDSDLIDLLYRTPPFLLNKGGRSKGLVRDSLARRFPRLGFERQRKVEAADYFWSIMLTEGRRAWQTMGGTRALAELGIVDPKILGSNIDEILAKNQAPESHRIGHFLNYEAWLRPRL